MFIKLMMVGRRYVSLFMQTGQICVIIMASLIIMYKLC